MKTSEHISKLTAEHDEKPKLFRFISLISRLCRPLSLSSKRASVLLKVVKLVATGTRTGQEVADLYSLKLQAVRDLVKDLKGK